MNRYLRALVGIGTLLTACGGPPRPNEPLPRDIGAAAEAALASIPFDSLCVVACNTIAIDSSIAAAETPSLLRPLGDRGGVVRLSHGTLRTAAGPRTLLLTAIPSIYLPTADTLWVALYRIDKANPDGNESVTFGIHVTPPLALTYGFLVTVRRRNGHGGWVVLSRTVFLDP